MRVKEIERAPRHFIREDGEVILPTGITAKKRISRQGYLRVCGHGANGKSLTIRIHVELAKAFIENPSGLQYVNHIDGNKLNNSLSNLEWCTHSENIRHAYRLNLIPKPIFKKKKVFLSSEEKDVIRFLYADKKISSVQIAKKYNVDRTTVLRIAKKLSA